MVNIIVYKSTQGIRWCQCFPRIAYKPDTKPGSPASTALIFFEYDPTFLALDALVYHHAQRQLP
jgi:hypothetical protein